MTGRLNEITLYYQASSEFPASIALNGSFFSRHDSYPYALSGLYSALTTKLRAAALVEVEVFQLDEDNKLLEAQRFVLNSRGEQV